MRVRTFAAWAVLPWLMGCVQWQSIPPSQISARPLPRWVLVTTRDSAHFTLEHARVLPGDTLTGRPDTAAEWEPAVRIPASQIAHMEGREPSGTGSIGVGALVLGGLAVFLIAVGHAGSSTP